MGYRLTGISTPIGGISWEKCTSEKERIQYLFFYLESKRILTNPIEFECVDQCTNSVLETKNALVEITKDIDFRESTLSYIRSMIKACNAFLDGVNRLDLPHIVYKLEDRWEDIQFDKIMKQFRGQFKDTIQKLEKETNAKFEGTISDRW